MLGNSLKVALALGLALATVLSAAPAEAQLFGPQPKPFIAPGRLFAVQVPSSWGIKLKKKQRNTVQFETGSGDSAMFIRMIRVPNGSSPVQVLLNAVDHRLKKLPSFKERGRQKVSIGGRPAATINGIYYYQGNLQFPRFVEEVYVVSGDEAFIMHFECFAPDAPAYAKTLNGFYRSFVPRPAAAVDEPFSAENNDGRDPALPDIDSIPF